MKALIFPTLPRALALPLLGILAATCGPLTAAAGLVVDDFTQGQLSLQVSNLTGQTVLLSGLDPGHVLGGSRSVYAGTLGVASLDIVTPSASDFLFTAVSSFGYFTLSYGSSAPLNVNLLADGSDQFVLNVASLTPGLYRGIFDFNLESGNRWYSYDFSQSLFQLNAPGQIAIPFSGFAGADLAHVQGLEVDVARFEPTFHIGLNSITTVPELSPAALVGLGLLSLALRRSGIAAKIHREAKRTLLSFSFRGAEGDR